MPVDRTAGADAVFSTFSRWRVWDDREDGDPGVLLARDTTLGEAVARGLAPPTLRLWDNRQALVAGRRDTRLPGFGAAARRLAVEGWPVFVRESGGGTVPHGDGILLVSLVVPRRESSAFSIEALYRALCAPLTRALADLGIDTRCGEVSGAFCDGRFNLVHRGRKLAGTAQRWHGGPAGTAATDGYALAHALLVVDHDLAAAGAVLNRFLALAGSDRRVDPGAATTVRECLGAHAASAMSAGKTLTESVRARIAAAAANLTGGA